MRDLHTVDSFLRKIESLESEEVEVLLAILGQELALGAAFLTVAGIDASNAGEWAEKMEEILKEEGDRTFKLKAAAALQLATEKAVSAWNAAVAGVN